MLTLEFQAQFKKDVRNLIKRKWDMNLLREVTDMLQNKIELPARYKDHQLSGNWQGYRDCHIRGNWVLIYRIFDERNVLRLVRTGSHGDLGL
ncbi:MAG: type II toxin-antitoxin system YafQ family toxin [Synergistaceae bacterium]|nr:type II toxin-antitoxin system YafQ family toxin [Synergistaceae bacterium]MBR1418515.1 type II toxin-antitoxin system YafQ family toxin [Synergistaceae bacterium]